MKLRFVACEDGVATVPGAPIALGQIIQRVNRDFVRAKDGKPPSMPAREEPDEIDDEATPQSIVDAYKRLAMHGDIWPYDEETAKACNVKFVPVSYDDGQWSRSKGDS